MTCFPEANKYDGILWFFAGAQLLCILGCKDVSRCVFCLCTLVESKTRTHFGRVCSVRRIARRRGPASKTPTEQFAYEAQNLRNPKGIEHNCSERTFRSSNTGNPLYTGRGTQCPLAERLISDFLSGLTCFLCHVDEKWTVAFCCLGQTFHAWQFRELLRASYAKEQGHGKRCFWILIFTRTKDNSVNQSRNTSSIVFKLPLQMFVQGCYQINRRPLVNEVHFNARHVLEQMQR